MMAATSEEDEVPVESVSKDAASSAKDYLEQHGLLKYVQSLLHAVIQVKPTDPYAYMILALVQRRNEIRHTIFSVHII